MTATLRKYRGGGGTIYEDIASRGDELIGINLMLIAGNGPDGVSVTGLQVRLVARSESGSHDVFTKLITREQTLFRDIKSGEQFAGLRLNKFVVPIVTPALSREKFAAFAEDAKLWPVLADWLVDTLVSEGFILEIPDMTAWLRDQFVPPIPKLVLAFPDLAAMKDANPSLPEAPKKSKGKKKGTDWDEEDGDEDEEDEDDVN